MLETRLRVRWSPSRILYGVRGAGRAGRPFNLFILGTRLTASMGNKSSRKKKAKAAEAGAAAAGGAAAGSASGSASGPAASGKKAGRPSVVASKKVTLEDFVLLTTVGKGSFGKVIQVRKKDSGKIYAMKVLKKAQVIRRKQYEHTMTERRILEEVRRVCGVVCPSCGHLCWIPKTGHLLYPASTPPCIFLLVSTLPHSRRAFLSAPCRLPHPPYPH